MSTEQFQSLVLQSLDHISKEQESIRSEIKEDRKSTENNFSKVQENLTKARIDLTEVKSDLKNHIKAHEDLKETRSERWKIAGIIGAIILGAVSLITQIL